MFKPKCFLDLCFAMKTGAEVEIDRNVGTISAIEREDGSGHNWNITMYIVEEETDYGEKMRGVKTRQEKKTVFFREGI